jgi:CheY-like chemotaxis protein
VLNGGNLLPTLGSLTYVLRQVTFAVSPLIKRISLARKILLADDSVTAQNMGRKILADAGYEVIAVNNGSAALKKIGEIKPDLVVLDVYMPGYSGLEVCQRLKESHETARIPVLLTVGKLEPFKPEEAQRVRAEAFIVKPFEASELLSALSKLEDKVVPRSEPSRPGRFARAIAAVEESGRGRGEDNGWKNRISFPHEKTEAEEAVEKSEDQVSSYNPVNRDLRTVVETPEERAQERAHEQEESPKQESPGREVEKVDVAALAPSGVPPSGLPKDVTQEELGAITAAAAQIQVASAALEEDKRSSEAASQAVTEPAPHTVGFEPPIREIDLDAAAPPVMAAPPTSEGEAAAAGSQDSDSREAASHQTNDTDEPVTMAAAADCVVSSGDTPRWTAVAVALEGDEAALSLDHEMQKASAAYQVNSAELASVSLAPEIPSAEARVEAVVPEFAQESATALETSPAVPAVSEELASYSTSRIDSPVTSAMASSASIEQATDSIEPPGASNQPPEMVDGSLSQDISASHAHTESQIQGQGTAPVQTASDVQSAAAESSAPAREAEAEPAYSESGQDTHAVVDAEATEPTGYRAFRSGEMKSEAQPAPNQASVKSTAAAWASWRQIRDTRKAVPTESDGSQESDAGGTEREANAAAAAAGAEQGLPAANPPEHENVSDVASIVDSVLADLRPKLMKEISRKIAEKK